MDDEVTILSENRPSVWKMITHPQYRIHRFIALAFMCFMGFGNYFVYDVPGALQSKITQDMDVDTVRFGTLYSLYSWPNVIISFFGGFLIDRVFGIRLGAVVFSSIVLLGQFVFALGALVNRFWLMQIGRFIFGLGGENLSVAQNTYAVSWFKGKELNMVFGFQLSFARLGSTVNFLVMGSLYDYIHEFVTGYKCLGLALLIATATCLFSFISSIILGLMDRRAERILNRSEGKTGDVVKLTDVRYFSFKFWMICLVCITSYTAIFPFVSLGTVFLMQKYNLSFKNANFIDGFAYLISAVLSPVFGLLIDYSGRNLSWVFTAIVMLTGSHVLFTFTTWSPWVAMTVMGLGYSILSSALWPMVALVIPEHQLGTAYGVMQSIQNLGLAIAPLVAGYLVDFKGYIVLEIFFLACLCLCMLCMVILLMSDSNGTLNASKKQREERAKSDVGSLLSDPVIN